MSTCETELATAHSTIKNQQDATDPNPELRNRILQKIMQL
jgi:hypothetical protein